MDNIRLYKRNIHDKPVEINCFFEIYKILQRGREGSALCTGGKGRFKGAEGGRIWPGKGR